jgi:sec-independent protein translocase protein TatC
MEEKRLPLSGHLEELRNRSIKCFIAAFGGFLISYAFKAKVFAFLLRPLKQALPPGSNVIYTRLPEAFFTYLMVAVYTGLLIVSPFIIYQIWVFVAPGLYKKEQKYVIPFVIYSSFFFLAGAAFGYFIVFPVAFKFLLGFGGDLIKPFPSAREYLSFTVKLLLAFGLIFEFPVVALLLSRLGIITHSFLSSQRRYAIIIFFIISAIITPPDVVSQLLMVVPLVFLYELSIILVKLFGGRRREEE